MAVPGVLLGTLACRETSTLARLERVGIGAAFVAVTMTVLGWQSGGSIGSGHLATFGPSPLRLRLFTGVESGLVGLAVVGVVAGVAMLRGKSVDESSHDNATPVGAGRRLSAVDAEAAEPGEGGRLAG